MKTPQHQIFTRNFYSKTPLHNSPPRHHFTTPLKDDTSQLPSKTPLHNSPQRRPFIAPLGDVMHFTTSLKTQVQDNT